MSEAMQGTLSTALASEVGKHMWGARQCSFAVAELFETASFHAASYRGYSDDIYTHMAHLLKSAGHYGKHAVQLLTVRSGTCHCRI